MSFNSKYTGAQVEAWLDNIKNYSANDILEKVKTVDGSGSGLDADLLDGKHASQFIGLYTRADVGTTINLDNPHVNGFFEFRRSDEITSTGIKPFDTFAPFFSLKSENVMLQIAGHNTHGWWIRGTQKAKATLEGVEWQQLARTTDNVASATKLQTARTLWGQSFDGTRNVSGDLSSTGHIISSKHATYDVGNNLTSYRYGYYQWVGSNSGATFALGANNEYHIHIDTSGNVGIGTPSPAYKLHVEGTMYGDLKMKTPITIWGASFDGTKDIKGTIRLSTSDQINGEMGLALNYNSGANVDTTIWNGNKTKIATFHSSGLDVSGSIHASGSITQNSDINLKNISKDILISLDDIAEAPLFEFTYKSDKDKRIHVGTSAQYWVEKNNWFCKKQDNGYYDMEIQNLSLASAISIAKEFKKYKEETESTISSMKKEIEVLKQIVLNMNK